MNRLRNVWLRRARLQEARGLYVDLLIRALTHTLYEGVDRLEIPAPEGVRDEFRDALRGTDEAATIFNYEANRAQGRDWPQYGQTMIGLERLQNVRHAVETVLAEGVPGDFIETGVWRGGVGILMRGILRAHGVTDRLVWLADSFAGLPAPHPERYPADAESYAHEQAPLAVSPEQVRENFRRYGLLDDQVRLVEGWFRDTLPGLRDRTWSVVRLDGDMYEATMDGLVNLYEGLAPGGFLIVDDYALSACRQAVEDFRGQRGIDEPIERVDWTGVYWRKRSAG